MNSKRSRSRDSDTCSPGSEHRVSVMERKRMCGSGESLEGRETTVPCEDEKKHKSQEGRETTVPYEDHIILSMQSSLREMRENERGLMEDAKQKAFEIVEAARKTVAGLVRARINRAIAFGIKDLKMTEELALQDRISRKHEAALLRKAEKEARTVVETMQAKVNGLVRARKNREAAYAKLVKRGKRCESNRKKVKGAKRCESNVVDTKTRNDLIKTTDRDSQKQETKECEEIMLSPTPPEIYDMVWDDVKSSGNRVIHFSPTPPEVYAMIDAEERSLTASASVQGVDTWRCCHAVSLLLKINL